MRDLFVTCVRLEARISAVSISVNTGVCKCVIYLYVMCETGVKMIVRSISVILEQHTQSNRPRLNTSSVS